MDYKMVCIVVVYITLLLVADSHQSQPNIRAMNRLIGQQPLLFGRRGMNPNMNSLFFGKRSYGYTPPTTDDVRETLTSLFSICQAFLQTKLGENMETGED